MRYCAMPTFTFVALALSHANYQVVRCYMQVWANNANDNNRHVILTF